MPKLSGNKGEWSEIYVFLRLLEVGKLYAADADLNKMDDVFYNIINIVRTENIGILEFRVDRTAGRISVYNTETAVTMIDLPFAEFARVADKLYNEIISANAPSFASYDTEAFLDNLKNNECKIIVLPEIADLQKEIERLRTELSMLLLERDELKYVQCKNIETAYMLALGSLEYKAYETQCTVLRLKRKMELIQAKKNRQDKVILENIEKILDEEFAEYQKKLDEQIDKMNEAIERSKGEFLTDEENKELKKLYRAIVKSLHPDLHPDITSTKIQLFHNAVSAYENGDLGALRIIAEMVAEQTLPENNDDSIKTLIKEKGRLLDSIKHINEMISEIKNEYPYILKPIIEDPDKIEEKRTELEGIIAELQTVMDIYANKIQEMLR